LKNDFPGGRGVDKKQTTGQDSRRSLEGGLIWLTRGEVEGRGKIGKKRKGKIMSVHSLT
jgi:hypothetical protein